MAIDKILIVDDEALIRDFLAETLRRKNYDVSTAETGTKAIALLKEKHFDLVITDMKMPGLTGIDLLKKAKEISQQTIVIVITGHGSVENAVEAMKMGAYNYLIKPFSPETIEALIEKACEHSSLVEENSFLRRETAGSHSSNLQSMIAESPAMKQILNEVSRVAKSNANIFIHGESGTGKEVIAQAIHLNSLRADRPFIKVNCAAVPETLIESEFFGHEKGAFTGANAKRSGRFELANTGSLLLDEITEIPIGVQAKLLRVIQEQEFERVGGNKPIKVDVRLIATSNRDMKEAIANKVIREDLYYRLNVVPFHIPPLRERQEDILPLAEYFIERFCQQNHKEKKKLNKDSKKKLLEYPWPGNVRELANIIERAVVMDISNQILPEHLCMEKYVEISGKLPLGVTLAELEKQFIIETLHAQDNDTKKAADKLGINIRTLRSKLKEYQI